MNLSQIRTDLALEAHESIVHKPDKTHGVEVEESFHKKTNTKITKVKITTKNGAKALNKPMGTYITLEVPNLIESDDDYHREISLEVSAQLKELMPQIDEEKSILVIGLGNKDVTADALGPNVVDQLFVTRHIIKSYGKAAYNRNKMHEVSALIPGVMAQTGMETSEIIKGVIEQTSPDMMIVIDALASRSVKRLNRTIQITDTGIHPGSGVGNHRNALTKESLGIPVVAIGIPTVVDAATIVRDATAHLPQMSPELTEESKQNLLDLNNMYVTSKDIDAVIKQISYTISEALNVTFDAIET